MRREFKAHCRIAEEIAIADATPEQLEAAPTDRSGLKGRYAAKRGRVVPVVCDFKTADPAEFDIHMDRVHGRKLGQVWISYEPPRVHEGKFANKRKTLWEAAPGPTRPPRDEPKAFEPKPMEPGADVAWKELVDSGKDYYDEELGRRVRINAWVTRTGQVWSLGWNRAVWVVPHLPWRDELAVLLKPSLSQLHVCQVWPRSETSRAAA